MAYVHKDADNDKQISFAHCLITSNEAADKQSAHDFGANKLYQQLADVHGGGCFINDYVVELC